MYIRTRAVQTPVVQGSLGLVALGGGNGPPGTGPPLSVLWSYHTIAGGKESGDSPIHLEGFTLANYLDRIENNYGLGVCQSL